MSGAPGRLSVFRVASTSDRVSPPPLTLTGARKAAAAPAVVDTEGLEPPPSRRVKAELCR